MAQSCCGDNVAVVITKEYTEFYSVSDINTLEFNAGLCINCGLCIAVCPQGVFSEGESVIRIALPDACMECGACQVNCPVGALMVNSGVGCAAAMINAALTGKPEASCGGPEATCCGPEPDSSCC